MSWSSPSSPNLPDFMLFVRNFMGVPALALPDDSLFFGYALDRALALTIPYCGPGNDYTIAVYNGGGAILINISPDQEGRTYFADLRSTYGLLRPSYGVVNSTSDSGTSTSITVPAGLENLTLNDLMFLKTPWGREFLAYQQDYGGVWGLS